MARRPNAAPGGQGIPEATIARLQVYLRVLYTCAEQGIAYRDSGFFASYAQVLRHLHTVGGSLRPELEY